MTRIAHSSMLVECKSVAFALQGLVAAVFLIPFIFCCFYAFSTAAIPILHNIMAIN